MTAKDLFSHVLEEVQGDAKRAMLALEDGEYLNAIFPTPHFECAEEAVTYAESAQYRAICQIVDEVYDMLEATTKGDSK